MDPSCIKVKNKEQIKEFKELKIPKIDIVIINLYPFDKYSLKGYRESC